MQNDDLIVRIKALFGNNFITNLKKADKTVDGLKDSVNGLNKSLRNVQKASKSITTLQNLKKQFSDTANKARNLKDKINDLKNTKGKTAKETEKLNRKLRDAQRQYADNTKKLGPLRQAITQVKKETRRLGVDTSKLTSEQIRLARATDKLKDQEISLARTRRRNRGTFSATAAFARGGLTPGATISAGAALNAGGMGMLGGALIGGAAAFGGARALGGVFNTGAGLDKIVTDVVTRQKSQGISIDKDKLAKSIMDVNEKFIFDLKDTGGAFSLAARSGIEGLDDLRKFSTSSLRFAQAEDITATKATDTLVTLGNQFGRDKVAGADELANLLSATASTSATNVSQLSNALAKFVKPAKTLAGLKTDEIFGVVSLLADVGMKGSTGTTAFKTAFAKVVKGQSKKFAGATANIAEKTGMQIDIRDPETGMPLPFLQIMKQLENARKVGGKSVEGDVLTALAELTGSRTLVQTISMLDEGVEGILERSKKIRDIADGDITGKLEKSRLSTVEGQQQRFISLLDNLKATVFNSGLADLGLATLKEVNSSLIGLRKFVESDPNFMPAVTGLLTDLKTIIGGVFRILSPFISPILGMLRLVTSGIARLVTLVSAAVQATMAKFSGGDFRETFNAVNKRGQLETSLAGIKDPQERSIIQGKIAAIDAQIAASSEGKSKEDALLTKLVSGGQLTPAEMAAAKAPAFQKVLNAKAFSANSPIVQANKNLGFQDERNAFNMSPTTAAVTNNVEIKIDGSKDPESTAVAVKEALQNMTFSQMEVPLN